MPPSSRKRNKGKDRKARQLAKKEVKDRVIARALWMTCVKSTKCSHRCALPIPDDHPVSNFMDQYYINIDNNRMPTADNLRNLLETHKEVWNNKSYRALAIGILIRIGTNDLLEKRCDVSWPLCFAQSIVLLEHYNGTEDDLDSILYNPVVRSKWNDIHPELITNERDALKFFRKRVSCKCLKKMHLEARKTIPKLGMCWCCCNKEHERSALFVCSRCKVQQYCSRECQVKAWPEHKRQCDRTLCSES